MTEEQEQQEDPITDKPKEIGDSKDEDESDEEGELDQGPTGSFISPEAVLMLPLAIGLDLAGLVLLVFGLDDFGVTDIIGLAMISGWAFFRHGTAKRIKRKRKIYKNAKRIMIIGELIPYLGAIPGWTLFVYFELKS